MATISVVAPVFNEEGSLEEFHSRLKPVLESIGFAHEIIYVDDGSTDGTSRCLRNLREADPNVAVLELSRNFGKEVAMSAGLDVSRGSAVVVIDTDLQDPPELIPKMVREWEAGFDVVYAQRTGRRGESIFKRSTAAIFYRLMQGVGPVPIPKDSGDFRLLSRRAVDAVRQFNEHHRFMKGIFTWIGYRQTAIPFERDGRNAGQSKWNYWKLWNFAIEGITSFTLAPLKIATYIGAATALTAFAYGAFIIVKTLIYGRDVPGYASLMVVVLFLGGIQLLGLGVLGEYIGRTFNETKNRPLYFIAEHLPARQQDVGKRPASGTGRDATLQG